MRKTSSNDGHSNECMTEEYLCAKLHLVDLAGSERAKRTGSDGLRFKEGSCFNILAVFESVSFMSVIDLLVHHRSSH